MEDSVTQLLRELVGHVFVSVWRDTSLQAWVEVQIAIGDSWPQKTDAQLRENAERLYDICRLRAPISERILSESHQRVAAAVIVAAAAAKIRYGDLDDDEYDVVCRLQTRLQPNTVLPFTNNRLPLLFAVIVEFSRRSGNAPEWYVEQAAFDA